MFIVIEVQKPATCFKDTKSLKFATDDNYDYFIFGADNPEVFTDSYSGKKTKAWNHYGQQYTIDDFLKKVRSISKRENFRWLVDRF